MALGYSCSPLKLPCKRSLQNFAIFQAQYLLLVGVPHVIIESLNSFIDILIFFTAYILDRFVIRLTRLKTDNFQCMIFDLLIVDFWAYRLFPVQNRLISHVVFMKLANDFSFLFHNLTHKQAPSRSQALVDILLTDTILTYYE